METPSNQIHVGLEIGTSKICVCVAEGMSDGTLRIMGIGEAPSRGVRKGEIVDAASAAECIRMAIREAEASSGIEIKKVSVAISGSHLRSFTSEAALIVRRDRDQINGLEYLDVVIAMAREVSLPPDQLLLQAIDGWWSGGDFCSEMDYGGFHEIGCFDPNELSDIQKSYAEASCHIIHGNRSRIQRTLDCLESLQLEVVNLVPSCVASSTALFTQREESPGVLVIDLGGGTSDFLVCLGGAFFNSSVLAVGGDHITSDISIGLRLPIAKAECVKIQEGSSAKSADSYEGIVTLKQDGQLPDYEIDRMSLNTIIHLRVRELFQQIRNEITLGDVNEVVLTGGGSQLQGIAAVAEEVFKLPVKVGHARTVSGITRIIENPTFTTVIGVAKYAMEATPNSSVPCDCTNRVIELPQPSKEFHTNEEYLSALRRGSDPGKTPSYTCTEDLDIPTFLRKGTDGMEIKHAKQIAAK